MARKDENAIVNLFARFFTVTGALILPALLGALALSTVFHGIPDVMSKFSSGVPLDVALSQAYSDYARQFARMTEPGGKVPFGLVAPAVMGAVLGCFLYILFHGSPGKKRQ